MIDKFGNTFYLIIYFAHFIIVGSYAYQLVFDTKKFRIDLWIGSGTLIVAVFSTYLGYTVSDYLNQSMMIGLAMVV